MNTTRRTPINPQSGYTIAAVLIFLMALTLFGTYAYMNSRTDIKLTQRHYKKVRANFVAESAVNWALAEVSRARGDWVPYTKATHDPSGNFALSDYVGGYRQGRKLKLSEVNAIYPGSMVGLDTNGWISQATTYAANSISGQVPERLAFKIWYPSTPVNTVRVTARGITGTDTVNVEFIGTFNDTFIPTP